MAYLEPPHYAYPDKNIWGDNGIELRGGKIRVSLQGYQSVTAGDAVSGSGVVLF